MKQGLFRSFFPMIILLWSPGLVVAQNVVQGLLIEKSGASRVANVSILNKNTGSKALSNELGLFQVAATTGDTLLFSKAGYVDILKPLLSMTDLVLQMQRVIELAEVKVIGQSKQEELQEFKAEFNVTDMHATDLNKATGEFGDLLFSLINFSRFININPEEALEKTNMKFIKRFQYMEVESAKDGKTLATMTLPEMDVYWDKAKRN